MTPNITSWTDFAYPSEEVDPGTDEFQYTMLAVIDSDDAIYYSETPIRKVGRLRSSSSRPQPRSDESLTASYSGRHQAAQHLPI
ncbi:hypothetical protein N7535_003067 [Penicillium sp. DV-2018c]|nr:hypothetical protein N7535_003067 [Penicillium sp. DV-2018c]